AGPRNHTPPARVGPAVRLIPHAFVEHALMKPSTILRALGAVALISLAARPASAQTAAQAGNPSATSAAQGDAWKAVPAGTYHLDIQLPERVMPATLTITDSSGTATA